MNTSELYGSFLAAYWYNLIYSLWGAFIRSIVLFIPAACISYVTSSILTNVYGQHEQWALDGVGDLIKDYPKQSAAILLLIILIYGVVFISYQFL